MKSYVTVILLFSTYLCQSQLKYSSIQMDPVPMTSRVILDELGPDFEPDIQYLEGPSQTPTRLQEIKAYMSQKYPKNYDIKTPHKKLTDPPTIINGFISNGSDGSVPEDNHIAITNSGEILSVVNSNMSIRNENGDNLRSRTLESFTEDIADGVFKFDPRTMYDPVADRFVFVCLAGASSTSSRIIVGFSDVGTANEGWNFYDFTGNPRGDNTWSDYPMISLTENELFLTLNLVEEGVAWQEGFAETIVYQIDKNTGYQGEDLKIRQWSDINWDGRPIRNLCPIKDADDTFGENQYLLSTRNFAIETDTIFVLEITGYQDDAELKIDVSKADFNYGAPPVANQPNQGLLETNDARILDGFFVDNHIQFVGNTINHSTGFADVFHGIIEDVADEKIIHGSLLGGSNIEFGYPGIAWAGTDVSDRDAIIIMSHSAIDLNPGISTMYFNNQEEYSDALFTKEGDSFINNLGGNIERWGDYAGCQRKYNEPGIVWTSSSYGASNNVAFSFANALAVPGRITSTIDNSANQNITINPNPSSERTSVTFEVSDYSIINITLHDTNGQLVKQLMNDKPKKTGLVEFSFKNNALAEGIYYMRVQVGGQPVSTEKLVIMKQ